ncbi:MAG: hypothetical protein ABFS12_03745 [Bacteroidota bacterium]
MVKLKAFFGDGIEVGVDYFFPNQKDIFADWFTGEIIIIDDENLDLGYAFIDSIIGDYFSLKFKDGELIRTERVQNKGKIKNRP